MKALSVAQPWASLLVAGAKAIEVRTWSTSHRGPLLICATASPTNVFCYDPDAKAKRLLHAGCIIGIVDLIDCRPMTKADEGDAWCKFQAGSYAWLTEAITFCRPDPVLGNFRLFEVPSDVIVRLADDNQNCFHDHPPRRGMKNITVNNACF